MTVVLRGGRVVDSGGERLIDVEIGDDGLIAAAGRATPDLSTRKPSGTWPLISSATPMTAHSATSAWADSTSSIAPVDRRWPATLMMSSVRDIT